MTQEEILAKTRDLLKEEGIDLDGQQLSNEEMLKTFILPGLKNSKDVLGSIYSFQTRSREGTVGKLKTKIQTLIVNTVINVVERQSMKQQKFNELTYRAIEALIKENEELKKQTQ